jgi:hypothetical protein
MDCYRSMFYSKMVDQNKVSVVNLTFSVLNIEDFCLNHQTVKVVKSGEYIREI